MKVCESCELKLSNKEFNKDIYGEYSDICKECEAEKEMISNELENWEDIKEYLED